MTKRYTSGDFEDRARPRPRGKIPYRPDRGASLPEWREWLSNAIGLPPEVRVDTVVRPGRDPDDPITLVLSNKVQMRCSHQKRLQQPGTLQAFLASESDGIAQPAYLSRPEAGDIWIALCTLGTAAAHVDPISDLHERLAMFVELCHELIGSLALDARFVTLQAIRKRPPFDRGVALDMRNGKPAVRPTLLLDKVDGVRYVRASEWVAYLRFVHGRTVNESGLVARMRELGSERHDPQAWNADRSFKAHIVLYSLPVTL